MTSKISFHNRSNYLNLSREYRRHHLAEILVIVFFVFLHVLGFVIYLQNILGEVSKTSLTAEKREQLYDMVIRAIRPNIFTLFIVGLLGALIGLLAFRFLHSKIKLDFYQSLPIKRIDMFIVILGNCFLFFLIPALIGVLLECVICGAAGYISPDLIRDAGLGLVIYALCFILCFLTEGLAMILTGNMAAGFLGGCVFALYSPVLLYGVPCTYMPTFFKTFAKAVPSLGFYLFSPMTLSINLVTSAEASFWINPFYTGVTAVWILVLAVLAGWLFNRRPSERAGQAMAFPKIRVPLRFLMVIPMSLVTGWALYQMTLQNSRLWLLTGIVISAVLYHGVVEAIYQMDIRGLWSCKKQMGLTVIAALVIAGIFWLDLFGYDSWLPGQDQIASVTILDGNLTEDFSGNNYMEDQSSGLQGEDLDKAYALISDVIRTKNYDREKNGDEEICNRLQVIYHLKSGRTKVRMYAVPVSIYRQQMDALYETEEYKKENNILYNTERISIKSVDLNLNLEGQPFGLESVEIKAGDMEEFLAVYKKDFTRMTFSEMTATIPMGIMNVSWVDKKSVGNGLPEMGNEEDTVWNNYYIYPFFTDTLDWLKEKGYMSKSQPSGYQIKKLDVAIYSEEENGETVEFEIDDQNLIGEVEDRLIPVDLTSPASAFRSDIDYNMNIDVTYARGPEEFNVTMQTDKETAKKLMQYNK